MIKRLAALFVLLAVGSACGGSAGASPSPTATSLASQPATAMPSVSTPTLAAETPAPTPTTPAVNEPSPACGGFHLVVDNKSSKPVIVLINGEEIKRIKADKQVEIIELFWEPPLPPLPWDVEVDRAGDGKQLASQHYDPGEQGARIVVKDGNTNVGDSGC